MLSVVFFAFTINLSAQTLGVTTTGTTSYPQTNIGNTLTETGSNAGNFLIFNPVTTTVPLTAIAIRTYGSASGTISVTIYNDNAGTPGTKLFTEVAASVTASTLSTITIPNTFLPAGNYWLAYYMNSGSASANYITKSTGVTGFVRKSLSLTYGTAFPNNPTVTNLASGNQDHISFQVVAIQGYAKATKATLGGNGIFSSVSFYSHAAGNVRLAIYSNSGSAPSAKQWESGDIAINGTGLPKWTSVNISAGTPASLNLVAGTYWLAWQWNSSANGPSYLAGAANSGNAIVQSYGAFPSSWTGGTTSAENWSIYASYTACTTPANPGITGAYFCSGSTATLSASGATSGQVYKWYDAASSGTLLKTSTDFNDNTYKPSPTGTTSYWVTIFQAAGCESNRVQVTATLSSPVATVDNHKNISCYAGSDGEITVSASGGQSPYTFSVDNGLHYLPATNTDLRLFTGLQANTQYKIRVKDTNECTSPIIP